jgi:hypothetical protein
MATARLACQDDGFPPGSAVPIAYIDAIMMCPHGDPRLLGLAVTYLRDRGRVPRLCPALATLVLPECPPAADVAVSALVLALPPRLFSSKGPPPHTTAAQARPLQLRGVYPRSYTRLPGSL